MWLLSEVVIRVCQCVGGCVGEGQKEVMSAEILFPSHNVYALLSLPSFSFPARPFMFLHLHILHTTYFSLPTNVFLPSQCPPLHVKSFLSPTNSVLFLPQLFPLPRLPLRTPSLSFPSPPSPLPFPLPSKPRLGPLLLCIISPCIPFLSLLLSVLAALLVEGHSVVESFLLALLRTTLLRFFILVLSFLRVVVN